jgi:hypothetical protein
LLNLTLTLAILHNLCQIARQLDRVIIFRKTMTLILTCLIRDAVVQVSDRRLVYRDGSLADDFSNKATVYCGHITFAYAGLAQLGRPAPDGQPHTDWWLMETLGPQQRRPREAFADVAREAAVEVARLGVSGDIRRTAFVGAGWAKDRGTEAYRPLLVTISNYTDVAGAVGPTTGDFRVTVAQLPKERLFWWTCIGQRLTDNEKIETNRLVKRVVKHRKGPAALALVFASTVRKVASRNVSVGRNLMISIMPIQDVPFAVSVPLGGPPAPNQAQFVYLPDAPGFEFFAPNVVCNGMMLGGSKFWTGDSPPPWWHSIARDRHNR